MFRQNLNLDTVTADLYPMHSIWASDQQPPNRIAPWYSINDSSELFEQIRQAGSNYQYLHMTTASSASRRRRACLDQNMGQNVDSRSSGESSHSEQLASALCFVRALQEQIHSPGPDSPRSASSAFGNEYARDDYRTSATPERCSIVKDAMMATTTIKLQPSMSIISGGSLSRRSSSPVSPPSSGGGVSMHSPRCSICPYEWDGQPPTGIGEAKIYRLNPSPGAVGLGTKTQSVVQIEAREIKPERI